MPARNPDPYLPGHGDRTFSVQHYELDLAYKLAGNFLTGRAHLRAAIIEPTKRIELDLHGLRVHNLKLEGAKVERWSHNKGRIAIKFKHELDAGTPLALSIDYRGAPKPVRGIDGEAGWEELADGVIVASQPHGAPSWFPCNDRSSDKASYRIHVSTDSDYAVIANGQLIAQATSGRNTRWTWEQPEPMAPYLATVQIGRYVTSPLNEAQVPITVHHPRALIPAVTQAFARQGEMLTYFESVFGPYPFGSYAAVVTADTLDIPLESQSLSTFGANHASSAWEAQRLIAHELSHQWFGNCVTAGALRDIWLHEGFACYAEWLWSQASGGPSTQERAAEHWAKLDRLPQDLTLVDPGPTLMFDDRVYKRGALTLHALRAHIGSGTFFELLAAWVERYRYAVVGTQEFVDLASEVTGRDLRGFFAAWLTETPLPPLPVVVD